MFIITLNKKAKRPGILVVHEWWGLNDYSRQASQDSLRRWAILLWPLICLETEKLPKIRGVHRIWPCLFIKILHLQKLLDPAIDLLKTYPQTDNSKIGAIGYCFGGYVVLNAAKLGAELKGVVSFHGGLGGVKPQVGIEGKNFSMPRSRRSNGKS